LPREKSHVKMRPHFRPEATGQCAVSELLKMPIAKGSGSLSLKASGETTVLLGTAYND